MLLAHCPSTIKTCKYVLKHHNELMIFTWTLLPLTPKYDVIFIFTRKREKNNYKKYIYIYWKIMKINTWKYTHKKNHITNSQIGHFFFFLKKFQPITSTSDDSSLLSNQDTNQFLVYVRIEPQISYSTIRDFIGWANWNPQISLDRNKSTTNRFQ